MAFGVSSEGPEGPEDPDDPEAGSAAGAGSEDPQCPKGPEDPEDGSAMEDGGAMDPATQCSTATISHPIKAAILCTASCRTASNSSRSLVLAPCSIWATKWLQYQDV